MNDKIKRRQATAGAAFSLVGLLLVAAVLGSSQRGNAASDSGR